MMKFVEALLLWSLLTWTQMCDSAPLQVVVTGRDSTTACVGDIVTYVCTLPVASHIWMIPGLGVQADITRLNPSFPRPGDSPSPFSVVTTADEGGLNPITTALSVTAFRGFDGENITCLDPNLAVGQQDTIAAVFGLPSAPGLTAVPGGDLRSFDFNITHSSPSQCVVNYIITATSNDGSRDITVPASQVDGSTPVNRGGFDLCSSTYNFSVLPVTSEGSGPRSDVVNHEAPDFTAVPVVTAITATPTGIMWSPPSGAPRGCSSQYIVSGLTDGSNVTLLVTGNNAASVDLKRRGFTPCVDQDVTVTPILTIRNETLTTSSATERVVIPDPDLGEPDLMLVSDNEMGVTTLSWQIAGTTEDVDVVIERSSDVNANQCTVPVRNVTKVSMEFGVPLNCSIYGGKTVTFCVQFISSACSSSVAMKETMELDRCPDDVGSSGGSNVAAAAGGGAAAAVVVVGCSGGIIIVVIVVFKKKKGKDEDTDGASGGNTKVTYHSAGATPGSPEAAVEMEPQHAPGAVYADPKAIEHETAASSGEQYALITSNTKAKKKNKQPEATANVGDMYSVPDMTKKKQNQNQGVVYADVDVANPQRPPPRSQKPQPLPDNEPVTYATVAMV